MDVGDIDGSAGLLGKSCDAVIEGDRLAVDVSCSFRIYDDDTVALHDAHHGLDCSGIDHELLLGDCSAKLEPVTPALCPENKLACYDSRI